ncbi:hypothetical protein EGW08_004078 [Elysia chlorotica]|uniref:Lens epithelium-derived growth factor integrase-binding domain-containing protein n=1 Tax=Elysia chlorotica TaxID=188477 RepID=A0A3S1CBG9_ELYCH|nr:hypothetical protein EGW08_004078 [Elysia chlorotica]
MSITSLSPVRSNCDAPKSQVGTRKQTPPKRSEEFAPFNTKKYEEKRLSSQPSESENLADDTKIPFEERQMPVIPKKKTVSHSNDGQLGEVSCVAESGTEKVIHPKFLPTSTSSRHDLKRSLSADRSLEPTESRRTKILHFLPPNICVGNQSSTGDKDFTAKPNLPTLSPPSPTLSSSSHQMPHFSEHVPGSFQNKHKEGEYTHHPHTRRKNLQEAVLSELERLTKEIRSSLRVNSPNMQQAIEALHDLDQLPITPELVMKVPAVLDTVKKCQRYEGSAEVRQLSHTIFTRYKALILHMQTHKQ